MGFISFSDYLQEHEFQTGHGKKGSFCEMLQVYQSVHNGGRPQMFRARVDIKVEKGRKLIDKLTANFLALLSNHIHLSLPRSRPICSSS